MFEACRLISVILISTSYPRIFFSVWWEREHYVFLKAIGLRYIHKYWERRLASMKSGFNQGTGDKLSLTRTFNIILSKAKHFSPRLNHMFDHASTALTDIDRSSPWFSSKGYQVTDGSNAQLSRLQPELSSSSIFYDLWKFSKLLIKHKVCFRAPSRSFLRC